MTDPVLLCKYNTAIALFMGAWPCGGSVSLSTSADRVKVRNAPAVPLYYIELEGSTYSFTPVPAGEHEGPKVLAFHQDWARLMRVYERIEDLLDNKGARTYTAIASDHVTIHRLAIVRTHREPGESKLEMAWRAAGEFALAVLEKHQRSVCAKWCKEDYYYHTY